MEESEIVYGCLCGLILAGHSEVNFKSFACWYFFLYIVIDVLTVPTYFVY